MTFRRRSGVVVLGLMLLAGCRGNEPVAEEAPLVLSVAQLKLSKALDYEESTGRTAAIPIVDITARATGYEPGERWAWCYVDQAMVDLPAQAAPFLR